MALNNNPTPDSPVRGNFVVDQKVKYADPPTYTSLKRYNIFAFHLITPVSAATDMTHRKTSQTVHGLGESVGGDTMDFTDFVDAAEDDLGEVGQQELKTKVERDSPERDLTNDAGTSTPELPPAVASQLTTSPVSTLAAGMNTGGAGTGGASTGGAGGASNVGGANIGKAGVVIIEAIGGNSCGAWSRSGAGKGGAGSVCPPTNASTQPAKASENEATKGKDLMSSDADYFKVE
ncbi:hypothetical protein BC629DRAFT_1591592 [Irpex lacteus]|nr:hypothetical protein BC629DRAFT_1591592 [Irpex lacteus]